MNINIGPETVEDLYNAGYVRNAADLYAVKYADLMKLERWAEKSARNYFESLDTSGNVPFERVLYALGIRFVGETVAKKLARHFVCMDNIQKAGVEELTSVEDIGERIAESIIAYFAEERNVQMINRLKAYGLQMQLSETTAARLSNRLNAQTFVISGVFAQHSRDEYKAMIEQNGGKNTGSISKNTGYILAGENMGPAKLEKARNLGVKIISENDFLKMIE
jgi:DNA ligase (NAD+)